MLVTLTCVAPSSGAALDDDLLIEEIGQLRAQKDSLFRDGPDSPLLAEDVSGFQGLRYFSIDLAWRTVGQFHRYGRVRRLRLPDTAGTTIVVERFGRFVFEYGGNPFWLEVYRSLQGGGLTVYFTDATNGELTYPAGRYAAVEFLVDGSYVLDFNGAYSPYCAYNPEYICPLPPEHNRLPFAVTAGELYAGPDIASDIAY